MKRKSNDSLSDQQSPKRTTPSLASITYQAMEYMNITQEGKGEKEEGGGGLESVDAVEQSAPVAY